MSSLPASIKRIGSKTIEKRRRHRFPHYKSMGTSCCHGNQSFDSICPKTLCSLSPIPVMLHVKFDQDWPTGFRDIQVWKDRRWMDNRPLVYTISSPGELKRIRSKALNFCCHGHQSFDPICLKTLCCLPPTTVMLHIKFDQDWPTGFRDIQVRMCGRPPTDGPLEYYKLTL